MNLLVWGLRLTQIFVAIPLLASMISFLWITANREYSEQLEITSMVLTIFSVTFSIFQFLVWKQTGSSLDKAVLIIALAVGFAAGLFKLFLEDKLRSQYKPPRK